MSIYLLVRRPKHDATVHIVLANTATPWDYAVLCGAQRGDLGFTTVRFRDGKGFPTCLQCIAKMENEPIYFDE
jgi:hypothetical protein